MGMSARGAAVVFPAESRAEVRDVRMPAPGPGEVQVRTSWSTVSCGTEGWVLRNLFTWAPTPYPCVPGYQRVGTVAAVGAEVADWQVGDRVVATVGCWKTPPVPFWGSHLAVGNTAAQELYRLPPGIDEIDASAAVVGQVGYNAASRLTCPAGSWVAVFGDGLIGQCGAQAARARGMKVALVGHRPPRLALAAAHSADATLDSRRPDLAGALRELAGAGGVRAVIDTVQGEAVQRQYADLLPHGEGQIVYSGFSSTPTWADMAELQKRELTTHFVAGWTRPRLDATLELMAQDGMRVRPLITHLVPFAHGGRMYDLVLRKEPEVLGICFDWRGGTA